MVSRSALGMAKRFMVDGRAVTFEAQPGSDGWRVLVDGRPVPMTLRETESSVTSSGNYYDSVLEHAHPVEWIALGPCLAASESFRVSKLRTPGEPQGFRASLTWSAGHGEVQGTAVYSIESITLLFPEDAARVDVEWDHHTDSSV